MLNGDQSEESESDEESYESESDAESVTSVIEVISARPKGPGNVSDIAVTNDLYDLSATEGNRNDLPLSNGYSTAESESDLECQRGKLVCNGNYTDLNGKNTPEKEKKEEGSDAIHMEKETGAESHYGPDSSEAAKSSNERKSLGGKVIPKNEKLENGVAGLNNNVSSDMKIKDCPKNVKKDVRDEVDGVKRKIEPEKLGVKKLQTRGGLASLTSRFEKKSPEPVPLRKVTDRPRLLRKTPGKANQEKSANAAGNNRKREESSNKLDQSIKSTTQLKEEIESLSEKEKDLQEKSFADKEDVKPEKDSSGGKTLSSKKTDVAKTDERKRTQSPAKKPATAVEGLGERCRISLPTKKTTELDRQKSIIKRSLSPIKKKKESEKEKSVDRVTDYSLEKVVNESLEKVEETSSIERSVKERKDSVSSSRERSKKKESESEKARLKKNERKNSKTAEKVEKVKKSKKTDGSTSKAKSVDEDSEKSSTVERSKSKDSEKVKKHRSKSRDVTDCEGSEKEYKERKHRRKSREVTDGEESEIEQKEKKHRKKSSKGAESDLERKERKQRKKSRDVTDEEESELARKEKKHRKKSRRIATDGEESEVERKEMKHRRKSKDVTDGEESEVERKGKKHRKKSGEVTDGEESEIERKERKYKSKSKDGEESEAARKECKERKKEKREEEEKKEKKKREKDGEKAKKLDKTKDTKLDNDDKKEREDKEEWESSTSKSMYKREDISNLVNSKASEPDKQETSEKTDFIPKKTEDNVTLAAESSPKIIKKGVKDKLGRKFADVKDNKPEFLKLKLKPKNRAPSPKPAKGQEVEEKMAKEDMSATLSFVKAVKNEFAVDAALDQTVDQPDAESTSEKAAVMNSVDNLKEKEEKEDIEKLSEETNEKEPEALVKKKHPKDTKEKKFDKLKDVKKGKDDKPEFLSKVRLLKAIPKDKPKDPERTLVSNKEGEKLKSILKKTSAEVVSATGVNADKNKVSENVDNAHPVITPVQMAKVSPKIVEENQLQKPTAIGALSKEEAMRLQPTEAIKAPSGAPKENVPEVEKEPAQPNIPVASEKDSIKKPTKDVKDNLTEIQAKSTAASPTLTKNIEQKMEDEPVSTYDVQKVEAKPGVKKDSAVLKKFAGNKFLDKIHGESHSVFKAELQKPLKTIFRMTQPKVEVKESPVYEMESDIKDSKPEVKANEPEVKSPGTKLENTEIKAKEIEHNEAQIKDEYLEVKAKERNVKDSQTGAETKGTVSNEDKSELMVKESKGKKDFKDETEDTMFKSELFSGEEKEKEADQDIDDQAFGDIPLEVEATKPDTLEIQKVTSETKDTKKYADDFPKRKSRSLLDKIRRTVTPKDKHREDGGKEKEDGPKIKLKKSDSDNRGSSRKKFGFGSLLPFRKAKMKRPKSMPDLSRFLFTENESDGDYFEKDEEEDDEETFEPIGPLPDYMSKLSGNFEDGTGSRMEEGTEMDAESESMQEVINEERSMPDMDVVKPEELILPTEEIVPCPRLQPYFDDETGEMVYPLAPKPGSVTQAVDEPPFSPPPVIQQTVTESINNTEKETEKMLEDSKDKKDRKYHKKEKKDKKDERKSKKEKQHKYKGSKSRVDNELSKGEEKEKKHRMRRCKSMAGLDRLNPDEFQESLKSKITIDDSRQFSIGVERSAFMTVIDKAEIKALLEKPIPGLEAFTSKSSSSGDEVKAKEESNFGAHRKSFRGAREELARKVRSTFHLDISPRNTHSSANIQTQHTGATSVTSISCTETPRKPFRINMPSKETFGSSIELDDSRSAFTPMPNLTDMQSPRIAFRERVNSESAPGSPQPFQGICDSKDPLTSPNLEMTSPTSERPVFKIGMKRDEQEQSMETKAVVYRSEVARSSYKEVGYQTSAMMEKSKILIRTDKSLEETKSSIKSDSFSIRKAQSMSTQVNENVSETYVQDPVSRKEHSKDAGGRVMSPIPLSSSGQTHEAPSQYPTRSTPTISQDRSAILPARSPLSPPRVPLTLPGRTSMVN